MKIVASGLGVEIGGTRIPAMFSADDVVLITNDGKDLRLLLDVAAQGVKERRQNFIAAKSKIIVSWR